MDPVAPVEEDVTGPSVAEGRDDGPAGPRRRLVRLLAACAAVAVLVVAVDLVRGPDRPGPPPGSWTLLPHQGLGAWVDAYDWTVELGGADPAVGPDEIDAMADAGVQTLYLQTGHRRSVHDVMEPERLDELIDRAHARGLHVVAWYLPTFVDPDRDLRRLLAAAALKVDGLAVDLEATDVTDVVERNRRMLELGRRLRAALDDDQVLAAITLSAVHVQVVNPAFWPDYPWAELAADYDLIMPMAYWSIRRGELADGERYVRENVDRIRASTGDPAVPIHVIGGIADAASVADLEEMVAVVEERGALGGSLYDWATSNPAQWEALQPLRALRPGG